MGRKCLQECLRVPLMSEHSKRAMPANQPMICTRADSKKAGKLIIREASQVKRKGKEDVCSIHQCFVC